MNNKQYNPQDQLSEAERELVEHINNEISKKSLEEQVEIHKDLALLLALYNPEETILCVFDNVVITALDLARDQSKRNVFKIFDEVVLRTKGSVVGRGGATPFDPDIEWRLNSQDTKEITEELYRKVHIRLKNKIAQSSEAEVTSWQWLLQYVDEWYRTRMAEYNSISEAQSESAGEGKKEKYPTEGICIHILALFEYLTDNEIVSDIVAADIFTAVGTGEFSAIIGKINPRKRNALETVILTFFDNVIINCVVDANKWRQDVMASIGVRTLASNRNRLSKAEKNKIASFARKIRVKS